MKTKDIKYPYELAYKLPSACIAECSERGDNYEACEWWAHKLNLAIPREICIEALLEYGAWTLEDLQGDSDEELNIKFLWIAAGYETEEEAESGSID